MDKDTEPFAYVLDYLRNRRLPPVPEGTDHTTMRLLRALRRE